VHSPTHVFELYSRPRSIWELNLAIKNKLMQDLLPGEKTSSRGGRVYGYTFPICNGRISTNTSTSRSTGVLTPEPSPGKKYIKIGFSSDVHRRLAEWRSQCGYEPQLLFSRRAPHHVRVEKLVHLSLANERRREVGQSGAVANMGGGCPGCGVNHKEWFEVEETRARDVARMWAYWASRGPYDSTGRLRVEERRLLDGVDLGDETCWERFVYESV
jgi:T5orf172 domain